MGLYKSTLYFVCVLYPAIVEEKMRTFGRKIEGEPYKIREGVYALIRGESGAVALVGRVHNDLHELPGGGLENGETHEEGLMRELQEELGWSIKVGAYLGKAIQYTTRSPRGNLYRLEGHFYMAEKLEEIEGKIEDDHIERWLSFSEAIKKVKFEYQRWAISLFEKRLTK